MATIRYSLLLALMLAAILIGPVQAQSPPQSLPLKVGVLDGPPFVMKTATGYSGMAIDLWQDVASKLGLTYRYVPEPNIAALLQDVSAGRVDIAVGNLTITEDRLKRMDFTQPWYDTGLRLMIDQDRHTGFWQVIDGLRASGHLKVYLWVVIIIVIGTVGLTLIDRKVDEEFPKEWHHGLAESLYHVISIATSGKATQHKRIFGVYGRVLAALWMVCGVALIAYVTSSITSVMTTTTLNDEINSVADLQGKVVGVLRGTVGEIYCLNAALATQPFDSMDEAVTALLHRQVAAIVNDAPVLEYYDNSHLHLPITEVGALLDPAKYGFATPRGSDLGHEVTLQIVLNQQTGGLEKLRAKYFGVTP